MSTCKVCSKNLVKNNDKQVIYYCSDSCRKRRHNKKEIFGVKHDKKN